MVYPKFIVSNQKNESISIQSIKRQLGQIRLMHAPNNTVLMLGGLKFVIIARKAAKSRNRYNQVPHLTQDTTWGSDKTQLNITYKSQEVSPFPAGDQKAVRNKRESMKNARHK